MRLTVEWMYTVIFTHDSPVRISSMRVTLIAVLSVGICRFLRRRAVELLLLLSMKLATVDVSAMAVHNSLSRR